VESANFILNIFRIKKRLNYSLNAEGKISGISLIKSGNSKTPPGNKKTANAGIALQMSNNCILIFSFSSSDKLE
jgi:hypothetical protein